MSRRRRELNNGPNIRKEKEIVSKMISIYCSRVHRHEQLCEECNNLEKYAHQRLSLCRFGEEKTACSNCKIHCYKPVYRDQIKKVMRYSGKWMLLYHPLYSIKHLLNGKLFLSAKS